MTAKLEPSKKAKQYGTAAKYTTGVLVWTVFALSYHCLIPHSSQMELIALPFVVQVPVHCFWAAVAITLMRCAETLTHLLVKIGEEASAPPEWICKARELAAKRSYDALGVFIHQHISRLIRKQDWPAIAEAFSHVNPEEDHNFILYAILAETRYLQDGTGLEHAAGVHTLPRMAFFNRAKPRLMSYLSEDRVDELK